MSVLPPPPRRIRRPPSLALLRALAWAFFAAIFAATLVLLLALGNELALRYLGHDVTASVTSLHEHPNKGGTYDRIARYTYAPVPGVTPRADSARLNWRTFRDLTMPFITERGIPEDIQIPPDKPATITVRVYTLGPVTYGRPVEREHAFLYLLIPAIFAPIGIFFTLVLYYKVVVVSRRYRRLYTHGAAAPGTIVDRVERPDSESVSWHVYYRFTPIGAAAPLVGSIPLPSRKRYNAATPGQAVTVLYDPQDPGKNTVAEFGGFNFT